MPTSRSGRRTGVPITILVICSLLLTGVVLLQLSDRTTPNPARAASDLTALSGDPITSTVYLPMVSKPPRPPVRLQNTGFEDEGWRETFNGQEYNEIHVPKQWIAYWKEDTNVPHDPENKDGYLRPEMKVISRVPPFLDPPRIQSGDQALQYFKQWGIYDAGVYQNVPGTLPGDRLRVSGWAHAWSANGTYDGVDNPARCSEGENVGCQPFYALEGSEGLDYAERNFTFRFGIDPTGGTEPWAETVVWGEGAHIYNAYAEVPALEAEAQSTSVTIFLRSEVRYRFRNCDSYWDGIQLELLQE